jgi:hypothetical protein
LDSTAGLISNFEVYHLLREKHALDNASKKLRHVPLIEAQVLAPPRQADFIILFIFIYIYFGAAGAGLHFDNASGDGGTTRSGPIP